MRATVALVGLGVLVGCGAAPMRQWSVSSPADLCDDPSLGEDGFCLPAERVEAWLASGDWKITDAQTTNQGMFSNPYKLRLTLADGRVISAKFKPASEDLDTFNNSPRRELAAYEVQKLFLDPDRYVVPPTVFACIPVAENERRLPDLEPYPGADCAFGVLAYWLEGVTSEAFIDPDRFSIDEKYREALGDLNILTALIGHEDSKASNFVRSKDPARPRLFAVDNGLSFESMGGDPLKFFRSAWSDIRIPVLPDDALERLAKVNHAMLSRLSVLVQMERNGRMYRAAPHQKPISKTDGVRVGPDVVQLGLTADEIAGLEARIAELLASAERGEIERGRASAD
jgi:hypothetical protein